MDKQERSSPPFIDAGETVVTARRAPSTVDQVFMEVMDEREQELIRQASDQFADQEMMADVYNRLNQNVAPGGIFGLLPYLGQSRDGGARFRTVVAVPGSLYDPNYRGVYRREGVEDTSGRVPSYDQVLIDRGMEPLQQGEIFLQQYAPSVVSKKESARKDYFGNPVRPGVGPPAEAEVLTHEFVHRSFDSPMYRDFADWAKENLSAREAYIIGKPLRRGTYNEDLAYTIGRLARSPSGESPEEAYDDGSYYRYEDRHLGMDKKELHSMFVEELKIIDRGLREFLTPLRQDIYGIRMPIRSLPPEKPEEPEQSMLQSVLDRIFN